MPKRKSTVKKADKIETQVTKIIENQLNKKVSVDKKVEFIGDKELQLYTFSIEKSEFNLMPSTQAIDKYTSYKQQNNIIEHPVNRQVLSILSTAEPNHAAAINIKAITTALAGWKIQKDTPKHDIEKFLMCPNLNLEESFDDILFKLMIDKEIFDDAYLEIKKNGDSPEDISIYHSCAKNIYVEPYTKNDKKPQGIVKNYHHILENVQFEKYPVVFEPVYRDTKIKNFRKYMMTLRGYSTSTSYYGSPVYLSAYPSMAENILIKKYMYAFFGNNASPNIAILITGGSFTKENQTQLKANIQNMKGQDNAHSVFVLNIPEENAKIDIKELQQKMDGSFLDEREMNRTEILQTHIVPPKLLGISQRGGLSSGSEMIGSMKEFLEIVINPKQRKIERFVNMLMYRLFGVNPEFMFKRYNIVNEKDLAVMYSLLCKTVDELGNPVMTVQEAREKLSMSKDISGNKAPKSFYETNPSQESPKDKETVTADGDVTTGENTNQSGNGADDLSVGVDERGK